MQIREVYVGRNVPAGVHMAVGIRCIGAGGVEHHLLVLDEEANRPRFGLVRADVEGQFLPDEVEFISDEEQLRIFGKTPIVFTRDSQGRMLLLIPGTSAEQECAIRVIDGAAQIAIGEQAIDAERFTPVPDLAQLFDQFRNVDWPEWNPRLN